MLITKREKVFLGILGVLAIAFLFIPQHVINDWEIVILLFVAFPLGLLVATDPERRTME